MLERGFTDTLSGFIEENKFVLVLFFDSSKTLDIADQSLMLEKPHPLGYRRYSLDAPGGARIGAASTPCLRSLGVPCKPRKHSHRGWLAYAHDSSDMV